MKHLLHTSLFVVLSAATAVAQSSISANIAAAPASVSKTAPAATTGTTATTATPTIVQQVRVAPGHLGGHILNGITRRAVPGHAFELLDSNGAKAGSITTATDGTYTTPALKTGKYTLLVREDLRLNLAVDETATITSLDIVLPQGPAKKPMLQDPSRIPAAPGGAAPVLPPPAPLAAPGLGIGSWALAAGGAAAVAVPVVANNSGGDSETSVSTSGLGVRR